MPSVAEAAEIWSQLYSKDEATYAVNLRAAGFPEAVVSVLVSQSIESDFAKRERALVPSTETAVGLRHFWAADVRAHWLRLQQEKSDRLRAALGRLPAQRVQSDWISSAFPDLLPEAQDEVRNLTEDYDNLEERVLAESRGHLLDDDLEMIAYLHRERAADLHRVLNDGQVVDYLIRRTKLGKLLLDKFEAFEPTPAEARLCYRLAEQHGLGLELYRNRHYDFEQAMRAVDKDLAEVWTPERLASFQRCRSWSYLRTFRIAERLGLGKVAADQVAESYDRMNESYRELFPASVAKAWRLGAGPNGIPDDLKAFVASAPAIDPPLPSGTREENVQRILAIHLGEVKAILGPRGTHEYEETHHTWIRELKQGRLVISIR